jgi:Uri superfamily endonuclease
LGKSTRIRRGIIILTGPLIEFTQGLSGTYLLFFQISEDIIIYRRGQTIELTKGYYIYVGSAFGAGGLTSRLHRHVRKQKKKHWHIDQVTMHKASEIIGIAIAINQKKECELYKLLSKIDEFLPIPGIGNSDCNNECESHFLKLIG